MIWVIPLLCAIAGLLALARCATSVRREVHPTVSEIERFRADVRAALLRVETDTRRARHRFDR